MENKKTKTSSFNRNAEEEKFIVCPVCGGYGINEKNSMCNNCQGLGLGAFFEDKFYWWGKAITLALINLRYLEKKVGKFINFSAFVIGLIGFGFLGWWIWQISNSFDLGNVLVFWRTKSLLLLVFWVSFIADMFLVYRFSEEERKRHKIQWNKYKKENKIISTPNNWQELVKIKKDKKVDVALGFSEKGETVVDQAYKLADKLGHKEVTCLDLFYFLLSDEEVQAAMYRLNIYREDLIAKIKHQIKILPSSTGAQPILGNEMKQALIHSYFYVREGGIDRIKPIHMVLPCFDHSEILAEILFDFDINRDKVANTIAWFRINDLMMKNYQLYKKRARLKPSSNMDRAYTAIATPVLNHYSSDITLSSKYGRLDLCVAYDAMIEAVFNSLTAGHTGIIFVGPVGAGKRTIINGLAKLMVEEDVPEVLKDKRLLELDIPRLLSGASPEQAEERLLVIIDEVRRAGNIILFVDNIENLVGITAGKEQSLEVSEVLASALEKNHIICLAACSDQNYAQYIENKPLGHSMTKIMVKETLGNQAIQIIESKVGYFEYKYKVFFSYEAIEKSVALSTRYMHDRYLPEKAIDLLEQVAIRVARVKGEKALINREDVAMVVSETTGIPVTQVSESEGEKLLNLEDKIHERMIDQEEAVSMVSASLRRARAEMREGKRPIASFLFLGPTGVGKTELAKTVADVYFGSEKNMIRLDMSEYQGNDSLIKMIGTPDGSLGYLTEAVRKKPFSLVLLDELEKAHIDILNLFLQVLDDGRLTDGQGRTIDFTNTIIIATSNIGAVFIQEQMSVGASTDDIKKALLNDHLVKAMRPELVNRFDGVIVFKPLSPKDVVDITRLLVAKIAKILEEKGIGLSVEEKGIEKLAGLGYDPKFGARPLRRLLQEKIEDNIANKILAGELERRDTLIIDEEGEIIVKKREEL